ncbi:zinc ribbon domain-containing protein [Adlercreutzia mucosicola]|uniref:zinc ribbon domain-containing protein n=1 Tax=Adlercreutzia mucosicola TaxID=580026 RepID=UPI00042A2FFA|nr:zinc ribbon domain-containing protein [Adlercreutzia mucosicola]MCR2035410.1 zinc ribbon domain-containing protein [Adlercreutzia mucosicola]
MGIFDNVTSTINRSTAAAGRAAETVKIKACISEVNKRRQQLAAQLGASLYEETRDNGQLRIGREALYDGIAACDAERAERQKQLAEIEAQAALQAEAVRTYVCPTCGSTVGATDMFCSGCGTSREVILAQTTPVVATVQATEFCSSCGAPVRERDAFCMACGAKRAPLADKVPVSTDAEAPAPTAESENGSAGV